MKKVTSWILLITFTTVFILQDAKLSYAMHSGSTDAVSAFSGNLMQAQAVQAFQPDLFTGQAATGIPLFVPPGRRGMRPSLALSYSSGGGNGWLGIGWNLDMGYIQRSTKFGRPHYDGNDTYVFSFQGVHSELVSVGAEGYRAKEEGLFLKFVSAGGSWTVWDKNGTRYTFGASSSSRVENASGSFEWCLDRVTDASENYMALSYEKNNGQIYLSQISYTGNDAAGEAPTRTVTFYRESRPDPNVYLISGYEVNTAQRLHQVDMKVNGALARRYLLSYHPSARTSRSLLESVTEYGKDGVTSLPSTQFFYQETDDTSYNVMTNTTEPTGDNFWNIQTVAADLFELDIPRLYPSGYFEDGNSLTWGPTHIGSGSESMVNWTMDPGRGTFLASGDRDTHYHAWTFLYVPNPQTVTLQLSAYAGVQTLFLNWDGNLNHYIPFSSSVPLSLNAGYNLLEATGYSQNGGYNFSVTNNLVSQVSLMTSTQFITPQLTGDFNGNGVTDIASFDPNTGTVKVAFSCCFTFFPSAVWITGFGSMNSVPLVGDWNSDGKADLMMFDKTSGNWQVATSNGTDRFVNQGNWMTGFGANKDPLVGDFNGDGKQDIGYFDKSAGNWRVALGTGAGFTDSGWWLTGWGAGSGVKAFTGDQNGDGFTDIITFESGTWKVLLSDGSRFVTTYTSPMATSFGTNEEGFVADYNGDGLADIGYYSTSTGTVYVKPSVGTALSGSTKTWVNFSLTGTDFNFQPAEFSGDGIIDPSIFDPVTQRAQVAMTTGSIPDLLSRIENGRGGSTSMTYVSSATLDNSGGDGFADLPMTLPLVETTTLSDGMGNSYTTRFSYKGGVFNVPSREFRGFREAHVTDAEGNQSVNFFYQDDLYKGRTEKSQTLDAGGALYTEGTSSWAVSHPYTGVDFVHPTDTYSYLYEGSAAFKKMTSTRYAYDDYGNVTTLFEFGEYNATGDERTTFNSYTHNPSSYILNRVAESWLADDLGHEVSRSFAYYDDHTALTEPPTKGNLTKQEALLTGGENPAVTLPYDTYGNPQSVRDARGMTTTNVYDSTDHIFIERITNAMGHTKTMTYDPLTGQVLTSTDANGQTATNVYDALGRLMKTIGPLDSETYPTVSYEYDITSVPNRVVTHTRVEHGQPETYDTYTFTDGLGRAIQTRLPSEDPGKQVVQGGATVDARGLVKEQWMPYFENSSVTYVAPNPSIPKITFTYETGPMARRTRVDYLDGTNTQTLYDGWEKTEIDANGNSKVYKSDAYGRLIEVRELNGGETYTTHYTYDAKGNLISTLDHQGNVVSMTYDTLGRKTSMIDPDMGNWSYTYDANGNLTEQTDAKGQRIEFTYDALNRVTQKIGFNAAGEQILSVSYLYDTGVNGIGRLNRVADSSGTTEFVYDTLGRTVSETKTIDGTDHTFQRGYDGMGRLKTLTYPDGEAVTYGYNGLGDVETVTGSQPYVTNVDYNASGQITKIAYGNGTSTDYTYNPQTLRLSNLKTQGPGGTLQDFNYSFDNVGNVSAIQDHVHTATQSFGYDDLNRLTSASGSYGSFTYQYDPIGNLTNKEGVSQTYGIPGVGKPHAVTSTSNGLTFDYDPNGNMISKSQNGALTQSLTYDVENRLTQVTAESTESQSLTYTLTQGWNLITFPLLPENKSIANVLSSLHLSSDYLQLSRYNAATGKFEHYVGDTEFNDFTTLEEGRGYEIFITNPSGVTFTLQGKTSEVAQSLVTGNNLLGNPSSQERPVSQIFEGVSFGSCLSLNGTSFEEVTTLAPGKGCFLSVQTPSTWTKDNRTTTTFIYDGDGGRVKKTVGGTETTYVGSLYETTSGHATKYVMLGDQRIATKGTDGVFFIHTDHLGSSNVLTDSSGNLSQLLEYKPYGEITVNQGTKDLEQKFTGQRLDSSTNLYFYNARYYDYTIGRFIQADPIIQSISNPQNLNRYSYCDNNPVNRTDPSGHSWKKFWHAAVGAFVGIALTIALGPAGFELSLAMAGMIGGMAGGALAGGLDGGWRGALMGGLTGAAFGGLGGWAGGLHNFTGNLILGGMAVASVGYAAATNSWDSLAGALVGGGAGYIMGKGFNTYMRAGRPVPLPGQAGSAGAESGEGLGQGSDGDYSIHTSEPAQFDPEHPGGLSDDVTGTFTGGKYREITLQNDVEAPRWSGGEAKSGGHWLTTRQTANMIHSPAEAQATLHLPKGNLATDVGKFIIPKGETIYVGRIEGSSNPKATQIYIKDISRLRRVE